MTQEQKTSYWKIMEIAALIFTIVATGFGVAGAIKSDLEVLKSEVVNIKTEQRDLRSVIYDTKGRVDVIQGMHNNELNALKGVKP